MLANEQGGEEQVRIRIPHKEELLGIVISMQGGSRLLVDCQDGKERLCRIPGRIRRNIWVKEGDAVVVKPWVVETDKRGDILWRYTRLQAEWLKRKGYMR
ncbi:MAG: translation initiation factor eIF-1A [Candidatus Micrarchaeota archaeon]